MHRQPTDKPYRVGVFDTVAGADRAIRRLLEAGFPREQISVVCSDKTRERHFDRHGLATPDKTGSHTPEGIAAGAAVGATIGGLAWGVMTLATGGLALFAAPAMVGSAAALGSFAGAMMTRGGEKEIQDYYDQAVTLGKVLVAVEVHGEGAAARLAEAERILAASGTEPVPLSEG